MTSLSSTKTASPEQAATAELYLELLKKILLNEIYFENEKSFYLHGQKEPRSLARAEGRDLPEFALTMIGRARLNNLHACAVRVLRDGVPGDFMEAGVWRGGASILMRGVLKAYGIADRLVWLADSFEGLPAPDNAHFPADAGSTLHELPELAISLDTVKRNFARFDLLDDQLRFIKGFFSDTLPTAPVDKLALLRLDGDMYESTYVSLTNLYDRLSPGGYVLIDDYNCYPSCKQAVADFAAQRKLSFQIEEVDWTGAYWRKT